MSTVARGGRHRRDPNIHSRVARTCAIALVSAERGSTEARDLATRSTNTTPMSVVMRGRAKMGDNGARDEGPGGERRKTTCRERALDHQAPQSEPTAGGEFANAFGAKSLPGVSHPGE